MAVLQKIRNRGPLLVTILGIALLLFILEIAFEALGPAQNAKSQHAGEVNGETVMIQDFQNWVEDWKIYVELTNPNANFNEAELNSIQDQAWQSHLQYVLIKKECDELGLVVTDDEVLDIIKSGQSQYLQLPIFMNQQTGAYDYSSVLNFLKLYKDAKDQGQQLPDEYEKIYRYYTFAKENIKREYLTAKYQGLLYKCFVSNPVEVQLAFDGRVNESEILIASVPFTTVDDKDITISDNDIKAQYEKEKERFALNLKTRDIKYVDVAIMPSVKDDENLRKEMDSIYSSLAAAETNADAGNIVRNNSSKTLYTNIAKTKDAYPSIFAGVLDSTAVGTTTTPAYDAMTNCYYTFKMLDKVTEADSVLFRSISIAGNDKNDTAVKADSVYNALKAGADFKDLAKKYNQTGDSVWMTSAQYQNSMLRSDDIEYIKSIYAANAGEIQKVDIANVSIIFEVLEKKNPVTKYNVASVVKELLVSDETRLNEYNKFSSFLAANNTIEKMEENAAKESYRVQSLNNVTSNSHNVANIAGTSEALRWIFDEAKPGDISKLYEAPDNHLLVVYVNAVNTTGYRSFESVKEYLTEQVKNEKKAEKILSQLADASTIDGAVKSAKAVTDTIKHVSFAVPTFVSSTTASEPIIGAVAAKTDVKKVSKPFKGYRGVYMLEVLAKNKTAETFDADAESKSMSDQWFRMAVNNLMNDLTKDAEVKDLRYKFY